MKWRHAQMKNSSVLITGLMLLASAQAEVIAIENATVMTITHGTFKGSVLVRDGKIAEVGEKVMIPPGATIIDASGGFIMPGIIDCHSHIAIDGNVNEGSV